MTIVNYSDESEWDLRGTKVPSETTLVAEFDTFHREWRISFDFFNPHEQGIAYAKPWWLRDPMQPKCAELFFMVYKNAGSGPYDITNSWCIAGRELRIPKGIPSEMFNYYETKDAEWTLRRWNTVELSQLRENNGNHYRTLKVNNVEISKTLIEKPDGVREMKVYLGPNTRGLYNQMSENTFAVNVHIDKFEIETWEPETDSECSSWRDDCSLQQLFKYNTSSVDLMVGDGSCVGGFEPLYDQCVKVEHVTKSWFGARNRCWKMGAELVRIESHLHNNGLADWPQVSPFSNIWIGGTNGFPPNDVWRDSSGKELSFTNWDAGQPNRGAPDWSGACAQLTSKYCLQCTGGRSDIRKWRDMFCWNMEAASYLACSYPRFGKYSRF